MFDTELAHLEAQISALVAAGERAIADAQADAGSMLGTAVLRLDTAVRRLEAVRLRVGAAHAASGAWRDDGARNAAEWHRAHRRLTRGAAARELRTAEALQDLPTVADQVDRGVVSVEHAAVAARAIDDVPVDRLDELDALVADAAPTATTHELRDAVTDFVHRVRPESLAERERTAFEARNVRLGRRRDGAGVWIDGRLDVVGGEALLAAVSALSAPRGEDDRRTPGQRRADAVADLAERALRHDTDLPDDGGQRPHVGVVVEAVTLEGADDAPAATLAHSGPVSGETARQLACDPAVHRVVTDGRSEVLDVGRAKRAVNTAQRRALVARDGGCVGCGAPPAWTDAHHFAEPGSTKHAQDLRLRLRTQIWFWADGGPTDLDNLALLCRSCHTSVHHRGWTVTRDRTGRRRARPPTSGARDQRRSGSLSGEGTPATFSPTPFKPGPVRPERPRR